MTAATAVRLEPDSDTSRWDGVVPLAQVLDEVTPAYGGDTWRDARRHLLTTPSEAAVIASLIRRLGPDGLFDAPVVVNTDELRLANGMHRVTAAWVAGATHVRVSSEYLEEPHEEYIDARFTLTPPAGGWPPAGPVTDGDELDYLAGWLRSFPLADTWVEQTFAGGFAGVCRASWHCPHRLVDKLVAELERRCARDRVTLRVLTVTPFVGDAFPT